MSCHSLRGFSGTSFGAGNRDASRASAAYEALRDDCAWRTKPRLATHSSTRTPQRCAAAWSNIVRAAAPA
jgi:hypothetical protein